MLQIRTTPHLYGISLLGDYQDLNALYDSISRYLAFYSENTEQWPYFEYEYMLSLNYDIRHAYQGDRGVEFQENNAENSGRMAEVIYHLPGEIAAVNQARRNRGRNGNLYFRVEILYPLVFHYLVTLEAILADYLLPDEDTASGGLQEYTKIQANMDRMQISHFTALLWENLASLFGKEHAEILYRYFAEREYSSLPGSIYIDALLHCQLVQFRKMTAEEKKAFLLTSLLEVLDSDMMLDSPEEFQEANALRTQAAERLSPANFCAPSRDSFYTALEALGNPKQSLYEDDFEEFLAQTYGQLTEEEEEPDW